MLGVVTNYIESFKMICKEYFEIGVMSVVMKSCIYVVVVCTGIGGIFNFKIFYEDKIFDDLYTFNFPISTEKISNSILTGILHSTNIKFSD